MSIVPPENYGPLVKFGDPVMRGIAAEVQAALATPPDGVETGGILLGRKGTAEIRVDDFEPVPCEHRFGASYILSEEDLRQFQESLEWFRSQGQDVEVVGVYRSHMRADSSIDEWDREWIERLLPDSPWLFLMVKPGATEGLAAEMRYSGRGEIKTATAAPFPYEAPFGVPMMPLKAPQPPAAPGPRLRPIAPPRRPAPPKPVPSQQSRPWFWPAVVAAVTVGAGLLGYGSVDAPPAPPPKSVPAPAATAPSPEPTLPPPPPTIVRKDAPDEAAIRKALDRWSAAMRSGDVDAIVDMYAPRLGRYFKDRNATAADVRRSVQDSISRYGRPAILRLSGIAVHPEADGRASVTFRKHWQTRGPRIFAGEEEERLGFVPIAGNWKIDSEEETRIIWLQRPR